MTLSKSQPWATLYQPRNLISNLSSYSRTWRGKIVISNARYKNDVGPPDPDCPCETCRTFSLAYLRHLEACGEILFARAATLHNLHFYLELTTRARQAILEGRYASFAAEAISRFS